MFQWYYFTQALEFVDKIPKEVAICGTVYLIVTDIHKRMTQTEIARINAEKETQIAALEIERIKLENERSNAFFNPETA